ncbi:GNAT family N-acetyltransferase [Paenibacillus aquistagni]|uniref:GNAT family N-acetyltransferase n=1 Tax=Paenibacillus aquistagni TaxID=1852522 RepID=UPI00145AEF3E|nr:GNAT family N-acetyltransferase [Paenibacillus aquistagni]NMM54832.1 GNAT family N-acetyltransferase [Paenibacillus aquistagni]
MIVIETPRLLLRDWKAADLTPFFHMNADEDVMRYFPKPLSDEETMQFYTSIISEFKQCGFGLYAVEQKETNDFIGFIGFHQAAFEADFTPCIEIGWRLKKEAWGEGYATEGAKACLHYGFSQLGFQSVHSFTAAINQPSQRVMNKLGMRYVKHFNHPRVEPDSPLYPHVLYEIDSSVIKDAPAYNL